MPVEKIAEELSPLSRDTASSSTTAAGSSSKAMTRMKVRMVAWSLAPMSVAK
jgi:hypothetical protein